MGGQEAASVLSGGRGGVVLSQQPRNPAVAAWDANLNAAAAPYLVSFDTTLMMMSDISQTCLVMSELIVSERHVWVGAQVCRISTWRTGALRCGPGS